MELTTGQKAYAIVVTAVCMAVFFVIWAVV